MTISDEMFQLKKSQKLKCFTHCHTVTDYKTYNIQNQDIRHRGIRLAVGVRL